MKTTGNKLLDNNSRAKLCCRWPHTRTHDNAHPEEAQPRPTAQITHNRHIQTTQAHTEQQRAIGGRERDEDLGPLRDVPNAQDRDDDAVQHLHTPEHGQDKQETLAKTELHQKLRIESVATQGVEKGTDQAMSQL